jgi:hypothetical protein
MCENGIAVSYLRNFKVIWDVVHSLQHEKLNPFMFLCFALHRSQPCMVEFTILRFIWSGKHFYPDVDFLAILIQGIKFTSYLGGDIECVDIVAW